MPADTVRLSVDLSSQTNALLEALANDLHTTKSGVMRKAIALVQVAEEAKRNNRKIGVMDSERNVFSEIIGL
ncbi:hypothetical protein IP88_10835 [alpha proteobacterium AAP81b]|nr:hypothetical protein IP88_10835 [alpha proteobacterium AAP81b]